MERIKLKNFIETNQEIAKGVVCSCTVKGHGDHSHQSHGKKGEAPLSGHAYFALHF